MAWVPPLDGTWVVDLDGVIWLAGEPIEGAGEAIGRLQEAGTRLLFATNNSRPTIAELLAQLQAAGISTGPESIVTSAQAAASMIEPGSRVLVVAEAGAREAMAERGVRVVEDGPADVVLMGWTHHFDYERLTAASSAVRAGARLIGTNEDPTYPTPDGLIPGSGALLAAVATASGTRPEVAGKPHRPIADLIRTRAPDVVVAVGDQPATDGVLARQLDAAFALVLTGVTRDADQAVDPRPDVWAADLVTLVTMAVAPRR